MCRSSMKVPDSLRMHWSVSACMESVHIWDYCMAIPVGKKGAKYAEDLNY